RRLANLRTSVEGKACTRQEGRPPLHRQLVAHCWQSIDRQAKIVKDEYCILEAATQRNFGHLLAEILNPQVRHTKSWCTIAKEQIRRRVHRSVCLVWIGKYSWRVDEQVQKFN